ncbi:uncharacterized protein LOC111268281 [Varroa jacobsoni]|uniref:uncharacterized protein LOC111268281 n=1 Tax=Varroa jacobsoni TaxID=62625 RepID=UPI000BF31C05|nr:uncharacterized protein LOC111268281 [Varroa jacobsoni]
MALRGYQNLKRNMQLWLIRYMSPPGTRHGHGWRKWLPPIYAFLAWNLIGVVVLRVMTNKQDLVTVQENAIRGMRGEMRKFVIGKPQQPEVSVEKPAPEIVNALEEVKENPYVNQ